MLAGNVFVAEVDELEPSELVVCLFAGYNWISFIGLLEGCEGAWSLPLISWHTDVESLIMSLLGYLNEYIKS